MLAIEFHRPDSIPADVLQFWRERLLVQDRFMALTAGPEWFAMMTRRSPADAAVVVARDSSGTCRAVVPALLSESSFGISFGGRTLYRRRLPVWRVCGGDLIEQDLSPEDCAALWRSILKSRDGVQGLWFDHVSSRTRARTIMESCGRTNGLGCHEAFGELPHYRLLLPETFEDFRKLRSPESLKKMDGRERALARHAGADCRILEIRSRADAHLYEAGISTLMADTWQSRALGHRFELSSLDDMAERGWLRSFLLLAGDRPAAFAFCFQGEGVFVYEQIGYNEQLAKFSPGTVLLYRIVERLYQGDTPACVDFGEGEADYKRQLANHNTPVSGLLVMDARAASRALIVAASFIREADSVARRAVRAMRSMRRPARSK